MSISRATTYTTYSFHAGREKGREDPWFPSPDIYFNSCPFKADLKYQISKGVKGKHKTSHMIQAHPCHIPCKYLSILDTFSGLMF